MQLIPLKAVPSQKLNVTLGGQYCTINLYTLATGLFLDLLVNDAPILQGVRCLNNDRIVREPYLGFVGDLGFSDTQGASDPVYTGLGSRYQLLYLEASDLAGLPS